MTNLMSKSPESWEQIKQFYKDKFGMEPELVDLMSDYDILNMCANGTATYKIATFLRLGLNEVEEVLDKYVGVAGWIWDLNYSPLRIYSNLEVKNLESYTDFIARCGFLDSEIAERTYKVAEFVYNLERLLDDKWI